MLTHFKNHGCDGYYKSDHFPDRRENNHNPQSNLKPSQPFLATWREKHGRSLAEQGGRIVVVMACKTPPFSSSFAARFYACPPRRRRRHLCRSAAATITSKEEFIASFRPTKQSLLLLFLLSSELSQLLLSWPAVLARPSLCPHQRLFVGSPTRKSPSQ